MSGSLSYSAITPKAPVPFHCETCGEPLRAGRRYFFSYVFGEGVVARWCERDASPFVKAAVEASTRKRAAGGTGAQP